MCFGTESTLFVENRSNNRSGEKRRRVGFRQHSFVSLPRPLVNSRLEQNILSALLYKGHFKTSQTPHHLQGHGSALLLSWAVAIRFAN